MKNRKKNHRWYALGMFVVFFLVGSMYSNCGSVETQSNIRQKIFIDEVQDIYPNGLCQGESCASSGIDQRSDGSYELTSPSLED